MLNKNAAGVGEGSEGLNFTDVLRETLPGAIIVIDQQRKLGGLNEAAESLLGLKSKQALELTLEALPLALREVIQLTFEEGKAQAREIVLVHADSGKVPVHVTTSILTSGKGSSFAVVAVLQDLASAGKVEEHMQHLSRLASIGTLSASMAHEIKNALVAVKTFLDLLIQQNKDAELANTVNREFRRIDAIVSQMLRFAGPAKPTFSLLHLHDVLNHSLRVVEHQLAGKKIRLQTSLAASPDWLRGDSYQLEQAFLNLFFNAIEATAPNGVLSITTGLIASAPASSSPGRVPETKLRVEIKDSGSGIPAENISRLFDPFFTTKKTGTGLGLSITRRIVHEHGGTIDVESALNTGTTFTLHLPSAAKS